MSNKYVHDASSDEEKIAEVRRIFGNDAEAILQKCGTIAYDYMYNRAEYSMFHSGFDDSKFNSVKNEIKNRDGMYLCQFCNKDPLTSMKYDMLGNDFYFAPQIQLYNAKAAYLNFRNQEKAAEQAPKPVVDQKLKDFLKRTVGSDELAASLTKKYGENAYKVALSAVIEPGNMVDELGVKIDGSFSSKNLLKTLAKDETKIDEAKLGTFLDGYAQRKTDREKAEREAAERAAVERQRVVRPEGITPDVSEMLGVKIPTEIPKDVKLAGADKDLLFVQDGKRYNLYNLPDGFVIKGDLDLSNRGLTELPDLSKVKVKGSLNLSGNNLTSIDGVLPEVGKNINLSNNNLTSLKGMPKKVKGNFSCSGNQLTTLEGGPQKVNGAFDCRGNQLTTLEGGPSKVGAAYICADNKLTNLNGAPSKIKASFACYNNQLTSFEGAPKSVAGDFMANQNPLDNLANMPRVSGNFFIGNNSPDLAEGVEAGDTGDRSLTERDVLARDLANEKKIADMQSRRPDQPSAYDERFQAAMDQRAEGAAITPAQRPNNITVQDIMVEYHSDRGK